MPLDVGAVHLGHDEGDRGLHPEGGAVVDEDAAGDRHDRPPPLRDPRVRRAEDEVGTLQRLLARLAHLVLLAAEAELSTGGAGAREQPQLTDGEVALLGDTEEGGADGARRADDSHGGTR